MNEPEPIKVTKRQITMEEAIEFIKKDCGTFDAMKVASAGFIADADYPFRAPIHCKGNVIVWPPADIHAGAELGKGVVVGRYTNIMGAVSIGEETRIQGFCFIPDCVTIGHHVFIGPNVTFCNVKYPKVREGDMLKHRDGQIVVEDYASIGAGVVVCPNVKIGTRSLIGAGAVVTKDVPPDTLLVGIPERGLKLIR